MRDKLSDSLPMVRGRAAFTINLVSQVSVIVAQMVISLLLTPVVLNKLGAEAYGFVGLVNNFVSYVTIVTTALNSLAGRFITISHHRDRTVEAETYYSSVFYANCLMGVAVLTGSLLLAANIESIVMVSPELVGDLQVMILFAFLNCALGLVSVVFGVAAFIKNQLYLNSIAQLISSVIRASLLCILFMAVSPHMWYYSAAAVVASVVFLAVQYGTSRRVAPEYRVKRSRFSFAYVMELLKSGVWASLGSINTLLLTGLDLWISNLLVGAYQMGILSVAKSIPNALQSVSGNLASLFYPKCAELYAKRKDRELISQLRLAMKFTSGVLIVPLAGLIVYGLFFYRLWLPNRGSEELALIQTLSVLTVISLVASALVEPLYYANTLANRIKGSVIVTFVFGALVLLTELMLLIFTNLNGLCVIAGVSSLFMVIRHCLVQPVYAARVLELRSTCFFSTLGKELIGLIFVLVSFFILSKALDLSSWINFLVSCLISAIIGYFELFFILFKSTERSTILHMFLNTSK